MLDGPSSLSVIDAAILADHVAISTYADTRFQIYVLRVQPQEGSASLAPIASFATDGEITCLSLCQSLEDEAVVLLAGLWREGRPWLAYARLGENGQSDLEMVDFVSGKTNLFGVSFCFLRHTLWRKIPSNTHTHSYYSLTPPFSPNIQVRSVS